MSMQQLYHTLFHTVRLTFVLFLSQLHFLFQHPAPRASVRFVPTVHIERLALVGQHNHPR